MCKLPFTKVQGVGNDFVLVNATHWPDDTDWSAVASAICDRHFGIGGDGLLVFLPSTTADFRMRMYNPDGTEDMCGNGLRCLIRYASASGLFPASEGVAETLDGLHPFVLNPTGTITVQMGVPRFDLASIPVDTSLYRERLRETLSNQRLTVTLPSGSTIVDVVNTGSTHAVLWRNRLPEDKEFFQISPLIERAKEFPERTSVLWAIVENRQTIRLRIWERGAGETFGCGTGACAAAVLARRNDRVAPDTDITVHSKGGTLSVRWNAGENDPMFLTGTAHIVYHGRWKYPV